MIIILTKNLVIEDYGIWVMVSVTAGFIPMLILFGLPYAMLRFLASENMIEEIKEGFYSIFFIVLFSSIVVTLLLFFNSELIAKYLFDNNLTIARILPLIVFFECLNILLIKYFRTFQMIKKFFILTLLQIILKISLVTFFIFSGYQIFGAIIGLLTSNAIVFIIMISLIIFEIGFIIPKFSNIKQYLSFSIPTIPENMSNWMVTSSDRYVIGIFLGTSFVAYYTPAYTLSTIILMILAPISFMLPPILYKNYDENNIDDVKTILQYSLKYFLAAAIPSTVGLSLLSKPILMIISTSEITSKGYIITPFIVTSALLFGCHAIFIEIIFIKKKTKISGMIWSIAAILNFGLNLYFVPRIGIIGAAITTLVAYGIVFIITIFYSFKNFKFNIDFIFILKSIFATTIMSIIIIYLKPLYILEIFICVTISGGTYLLILFLLKGFSKEEYKLFKELFQMKA